MSQHQQRPTREERRQASKNLPVASKCLAIVLLPQKKQTTKNSEDVNSGDRDRDRKCANIAGSTNTATENSKAIGLIGGTSAAGASYNGKTLLEDFKQQNKTCYWNPALIESIRQLEYLGFVEPCTVLVGGDEIHLENLRSAWGRRVLKPPTNFTIDRIGDVNGIQMQVIPQTQFIPLPDSLCLIITELNNVQQAATLDSIRARLQRWYQNTALPSHQLIYDTLGQLIRERKVFHNGTGYCVVTPETYHLPTSDPALTCTASWLPYHPMYIPVFPQQQHTFRAPTRSISCQVTQIEEKLSSDGSVKQQKVKPRPRSASVRACRGKDKAAALAEKENAEFKRTMSARYKTEKAKAMTKDLNLKTSNLNQEKDKGEKVSLFAKIFGRKKKKLASAGATTASTSSGGGNQSSEVEYATFSAQFPPPEWVWYQQQLERHRRTEEWVSQQTAKATPWQQFGSTGAEASSGLSGSGRDSHCPADTANRDLAFTEFSHANTDIYGGGKSHVYATLGVMHGITETREVYGSGGHDRREEEERRLKQINRLSGSHAKKSHGHNHHREHHHHKHKEHRKTIHENNYDVPAPQSQVQNRMPVGATNMDMTPLTIEPDGVYATPGPGQSERFIPWHSTPCYDVPPSQLDSHLPSNIVYNSTTQEQSDALKPHHRHRSHRSKRHGRKQYYYESGNDITIEYKGRMPKKNSTVAQSRDSGVNCIGGLPHSRQVYMNQPDLNMTQEIQFSQMASTDQPTLTTTAAAATASSLQPHTMSTQRGTPYSSMDQRSPEGSSGDHAIIINDISTDITDSGASARVHDVCADIGETDDGSGDTANTVPPQMDERSECEGISQEMMPNFVAMSYCDSSIGEDGAGGGEVILCQAEINQFQIPQLVLDTEPQANRSNLSAEPDVALSSAGSKDTLDRTADESEQSAETVIRSPQAAGGMNNSRSPKKCTFEEPCQPTLQASSAESADMVQRTSSSVTPRDEEMNGGDENQAVSALGNELQEMGVVDSGFSSPRNNDNKENQQHEQSNPTVTSRQAHQRSSGQNGRNHHNHQNGNETEGQTAPEHKSKHERIKAFVKQSNQLLEQRQFSAHAHNGNVGRYSPDVDGYPSSHPHLYTKQHQHYAPVPKPLHPIQHHHQLPPQQQLQPPHHHHHPQQHQHQQQVPNNQRHHHQGRPQSMHGASRERPRSQPMWPGGDKVAPSDLQAFQQQQLSNKKMGLNGEFEVMGVV